MANTNLVEGTQACVCVPARAWTLCLNPCPSSKPLSSLGSSKQTQKGWDKVLFCTLTISFRLPQTQGGLNEYTQLWGGHELEPTLPHLLPAARQIWDAACWRESTGTPHLSHKCANAYFGAFAQFPLYTYEKDGQRRRWRRIQGDLLPPHKWVAEEAQWTEQALPQLLEKQQENEQQRINTWRPWWKQSTRYRCTSATCMHGKKRIRHAGNTSLSLRQKERLRNRQGREQYQLGLLSALCKLCSDLTRHP